MKYSLPAIAGAIMATTPLVQASVGMHLDEYVSSTTPLPHSLSPSIPKTNHPRWHQDAIPSLEITKGVTHAYIAFSNPADLLKDDYTLWHDLHTKAPRMTVPKMRSLVEPGTKVLISVGGWGWTSEFAPAAATAEGRANFAQHVKNKIDQTGADGVGMYLCMRMGVISG